jgi:hypothetical protein
MMRIKIMGKTKSITIIGKRWFDKVNGNTYYSAIGLVNGKQETEIKFSYGYGVQYEQDTIAALRAKGFLKETDEKYPKSATFKDVGIDFYSSVSDVRRKKDL